MKSKPPQKLAILFVTRTFPPATGGMERLAYDLSSNLAQNVDLYIVKWGGKSVYLPLVAPYMFLKSCWVLMTKNVDVIHMQDGSLAPMGYIFKIIFRKPLCVMTHGLDVTFPNRIYQFFIPAALRKADLVVCNSQATQKQVMKRGVKPISSVTIPLGITDDIYDRINRADARRRLWDKLNIDPSSLIILSVGRLVKRKGVEWFIGAVMPDLSRQFPQVVFLVAGSGPDRARIQQAIKLNQLDGHVKLLGRVSDEMLVKLYNGSDVFVMPNIPVGGDIEGFGRVLLEASLCRLPIVATGIEGIKDAISDGKNGILLEPKNAKAFIASISKFLSKPKLATIFGGKSRNYTLEKYGWAYVTSLYIQQYSLLKSQGV